MRNDVSRRSPAPPRRVRAGVGGWLPRLTAFVLREAGSALAKVVSFVAFAALFLIVLLDGAVIVMDKLDPRLQGWLSERVAGPDIEVGSIEFSLGSGDTPAGLTLNDIVVAETETSPAVRVPTIETGFAVVDMVREGLRPRSVTVSGAEVSVQRDRSGTLRLFGGELGDGLVLSSGKGAALPELGQVLDALGTFEAPQMFGRLETIALDDVGFRFDDLRHGTSWSTEGASLSFSRDDAGLTASLRAEIKPDDGALAAISVRLQQGAGSGETRLAFDFDDARPADVAALVPALDWLRVIDAPVDGALAALVDGSGDLLSLSGTLSIGKGALSPDGVTPLGFDSAKLYFNFDPETEIFTIDTLEVVGQTGRLSALGRVSAPRDEEGRLIALVGEMTLADMTAHLPEYLSDDLSFEAGELVARLTLAPFRLEIGSASLRNGPERLTLSGDIAAREDGWAVSVDAQTQDLQLARGMTLWPHSFRPQTRAWIAKHILKGRIDTAQGFLRADANGTEVGFDFDFSDGAFRPLDTMPKVVAARGSGQMIGDRFDIVLDRGVTGAGQGAGIDLSGSRMIIANTRQDPPEATFLLEGQGRAGAILELIDNRPLGLLSRAGRGTDLAEGWAEASATLTFPLLKKLPVEQVEADVVATVSNLRSDTAVPGRMLAADTLRIAATTDRLQIGGDVELDAIPMQMFYERGFGDQAQDTARVTGTMEVTRPALDRLGIALPSQSFDGKTVARFALSLPEGAPMRYDVTLPLAGVAIEIPQLGWRKSASSAGNLSVAGALGDSATVEEFALAGPNLLAEGRLDLNGTVLAGAEFERLRLGRWLDAPVVWTPADGTDRVRIAGGTIDLRSGLSFGTGGDRPIDVSLAPDRIIVSDTIYLRGVEGALSTRGGVRGRFTATVNGGAEIDGVIRPGPEIFVSSDAGGEALAAANIFGSASGGTLRARFKPEGDSLTGAFSLQGTRVQNAPVLAEILNLASVIGFADRLAGPGIGFDDVQGRFTIVPGRIQLSSARAVGPSLGVTLDGIYDARSDQLAMEGVVSPLYMVNGMVERLPLIGRLLGGRPGEGLLGANFRLTGDADAPQVSVNPLSVLTPGATREIFQSRSAAKPLR